MIEGIEGKEREMEQDCGSGRWTVWLIIPDRIASMHPVESGEKLSFPNKEYFFKYLQDLQLRGFRFQ